MESITLFLLLVLLLCFTICATSWQIVVNNLIDSEAINCFQTNLTDACNFRSAWETCKEYYSFGNCYIKLPAYEHVYMDIRTYGGLTLNTTTFIFLQGSGSTIAPLSAYQDLPSTSFITYFDVSLVLSRPVLSISNMTFSGFHNTNNTDGAVIHIHGNVEFTVTNSTFYNNSATNGGSIYVYSSFMAKPIFTIAILNSTMRRTPVVPSTLNLLTISPSIIIRL
jgi:hypothetical protein